MPGLVQFLATCLTLVVLARAQAPGGDPDALYDARADLVQARSAAAIWDARLATNPQDFESAWKRARAAYWLGGHVPAGARRAEYERGIATGRQASAIRPNAPEGHFWAAANMGAMAESFGLINGLRYRGPVKAELETVLRLEEAYQQGSADRALGRWYFRVPGLFGGSDRKSVEHLQRSLTYDPTNAASHFFLGETYAGMGRKDDARAEWQRVLDAPATAEWAPEVAEFKTQARAKLAALR